MECATAESNTTRPLGRGRKQLAWVFLLLLLPAGSAAPAPALRNPDGSCTMFPPDSPWHQDVSKWPIYRKSRAVVDSIGSDTSFHADFCGGELRGGTMAYYGIPVNDVDTNPAKRAKFPGMTFDWYPEESDKGAYPFPLNAKIEGAWQGCSPSVCDGDRHVLVRDNHTCLLYEGYHCTAPARLAGKWTCGSGAIFNLSSPALVQRPVGWTSADAAGLPIWAGLITVDDVLVKGAIDHAIRFTATEAGVQPAYQYPATHLVEVGGGTNAGWMGMRARLRAGFDCRARMKTPAARVICQALKKTGLILADVGSSWYLTGEASPLWEQRLGASYDRFLTDIKSISGSDVEVVVPPTGLCLCTHPRAYDCDRTTCPL